MHYVYYFIYMYMRTAQKAKLLLRTANIPFLYLYAATFTNMKILNQAKLYTVDLVTI